MVGIGPGNLDQLSYQAYLALKDAQVVIGYKTYVDLIQELLSQEQEVIASGMTREIERCQLALDKAKEGKRVCLVSSGDPGVYGMAGIMHEIVHGESSEIPIHVVPGITAANAAAAVLGAPLMHDYAVISLSDLLTPWEVITKRVEMAAKGDFVIVLYNPKSKGRVTQIEEVRELLLSIKPGHTPVGIVTNAKRAGESKVLSTLADFTKEEINMFSLVIVGNSQTKCWDQLLVTPRGYKL